MNDYAIILRNGIGRSGLPNEKELIYAAVEKQIPRIPILQGDGYADGYMVYDTWECLHCGEQYDVDGIYKNWKYCPNCGQKIYWVEQEESEE